MLILFYIKYIISNLHFFTLLVRKFSALRLRAFGCDESG